ncbi:MAG: tRNA 2-thiouridine(34) synthase MnmA [Alphaproteobacteria bacterium]|nr:tRNA 2-thiouridine(34) synthase MnmA [Alphaproteobacteria bacterium]
MTHRQKIVVAMSGGVDSSCATALLAEQGHEVIGITMQLYDSGVDSPMRKGACCAGQDIYDAKRVAARLGIPHYVLNYQSRFAKDVIQDFADSYARGETPIPCIKCNQTVKFRDLLAQARTLGADHLATGHYIQRVETPEGIELRRGADSEKDQSYFLYATRSDQLQDLLFPLGGKNKIETRALALRFGLSVADKPDSQDICFVSDAGGYAKIVQQYRADALKPGHIVDLEGNILGRHRGVIFYTIGQRRGLGLGGLEKPLYVVAIDLERAEVVVGSHEALMVASVIVEDINWLMAIPDQDYALTVQFRSRMTPIPAMLKSIRPDRVEVHFETPQYGVSPGQACVFYAAERVLGGGTMRTTRRVMPATREPLYAES